MGLKKWLHRKTLGMSNDLKYLFSFIFPLSVTVFLITGPHTALDAMLWTLPLWIIILIDWLSPALSTDNTETPAPESFYKAILYALAMLHFFIIGLMLHYASQLQWHSIPAITNTLVNIIVLRILVGTSSGSSAIIVAHEFIHRRNKYERLLGRMLLCTVCYEHFIISHLYTHHPNVATQDDIATARLNEDFNHYWQRVYRQNFYFAWRYEQKRLKNHPPTALRFMNNRVFHGLLFETVFLIFILFYFGWTAGGVFLYQALSGVRLLETINYYQHWGLLHDKSDASLAWVNDSSFSHYALIGLDNHIGHHQNATLPFYKTPYISNGPKMPYGYFVTNLWVKLHNARYRKTSLAILKQNV